MINLTGGTPQIIEPVYNPFYFIGTSSNISQPNFRFVMDVYTASSINLSSQSFITRYRILPRPGANNFVFSPARALENYHSSDLYLDNYTVSSALTIGYNLTGGTSGTTQVLSAYVVKFGEEYGLTSTGTTIYSGLSGFTGYSLNAVRQYTDVQNWNYLEYVNLGSTSKFLTNRPSEIYIKNSTDRDILSILRVQTSRMRVTTYQNSGSTRSFILSGIPANNQHFHYGTGVWNLNNYSATTAGTFTIVNLNTDYKYTCQLIDFNSSPNELSEIKTYLIDDRSCKYETIRLIFLNRLGGWDGINFNLVSRRTINPTRTTYKKVLPYNYVVGMRGTSILDIDTTETKTITSDWFNDNESTWIEELFTSPEVYEQQSDGTILPIIINTSSIEIKKSINDKLFNYSLDYTMAHNKYSQRG